MNKILSVLVSAIFPISAVNAQVQVAPATGASSAQQTQQKNDPKSERSGHGHARGSASVAAPVSAQGAKANPQVSGPSNPQ